MNPEKLHDALNLLEDDLILPVERLREKKRVFRWRHVGALAACVAVCVLGLYGFGLLDRTKTNDTAPEDSVVQVENIQDVGNGVVDQGRPSVPAERPSVLVRIDKWEENGFAGTVWKTVDTDLYPVGTPVTVCFEKNAQLAVTEDTIIRYTHHTPGTRPFAEGSVVQVLFRTAAAPEGVSSGKETTRTILYAELIAPAE